MAVPFLLISAGIFLLGVQGTAAVSNCAKPGGGFLSCELDCCYSATSEPYCCASVMTILGFVSLAIGIVSSIVIVICCCMSGRCCNKNRDPASVHPAADQGRQYPQRDNWSKQQQSHRHHDNRDNFYGDPAYPPPYSSPSPRFGDPAYPPGKGPSPMSHRGYGGYGAPY